MGHPVVVVFYLVTFSLGDAIPNWKITENDMTSAFKQANKALRRINRSLSTPFNAHSTYIGETNGFTCYVCEPGFYWTGDCQTNMTIGKCTPCPIGTYNSRHTIAHRCADCTPHCTDTNAEVTDQCTSTTDIQCRCKEGYYNHSKGPGEWICMPHSKCLPGTEPVQQGTSEVDTKCQKCAEGFYSPKTSSTAFCVKCSNCESGRVAQICTGIKDTVCGPKADSQGDYLLKVGLPTILVLATVIVLLVFYWKCRQRKGTFSEICKLHIFSCCRENRQTDGQESAQPEKISSGQPNVNYGAGMCDYKVQENQWTQIFCKISSDVDKKDWKSPIRALFARYYNTSEIENRLEEISCNFPDNVKEQIYQCLLLWQKRGGQEASLDQIIEALASENMTGLALELTTYGTVHTIV